MFNWLTKWFSSKPAVPAANLTALPLERNSPNAKWDRNQLRMSRLADMLKRTNLDSDRREKLQQEYEYRQRVADNWKG